MKGSDCRWGLWEREGLGGERLAEGGGGGGGRELRDEKRGCEGEG